MEGARIDITHDPSNRTTFCNSETRPELLSLDMEEEKSLLMNDTKGEDRIQVHVKNLNYPCNKCLVMLKIQLFSTACT